MNPNRHPTARTARGFTLIEVMIATAVTGVLSSIAYPSFMGTVHKVRRTDAMVAMLQVQAAQERWRSNSARYGSLDEIRQPARSAAGHYELQVVATSATGYEVLATARGPQGHDTTCRTLKLTVVGGNAVHASGPDADVANGSDTNRRCWSL